MASAAVFNPFAPASINSHDATLLKSILDEPVNFKEVTAVVGTVDPSGKGWVEVNPVKQAKGGKQLNGVQGVSRRRPILALHRPLPSESRARWSVDDDKGQRN